MLTEAQREIFSKLIEANWNLNRLYDRVTEKGTYQPIIDAEKEVVALTNELRESMGKEAFDKFMSIGKEMFS
jgi:hypothetical protein